MVSLVEEQGLDLALEEKWKRILKGRELVDLWGVRLVGVGGLPFLMGSTTTRMVLTRELFFILNLFIA